MKNNTETKLETADKQDADKDHNLRLIRLVGLVRDAVAKTAGTMILDLVVYEEDDTRVAKYIAEAMKWGSEMDAVKHAIKRLFVWHEDRMIDAAREDAESGKRCALESLPNV